MSVIKEAFLLSAGLGTRLKPITDTIPKPLVKVCGKPLIQWNLELLARLGCNKIIINVHYKKDQIIDYLRANPIDGVTYIVSEEDKLLDTGGGLKKVFEYLDGERFYTWNADNILDPRVVQDSNGGIPSLVDLSFENKALISLFLKKIDTPNLEKYSELMFDSEMCLCNFLGEDFSKGQVSGGELTKFIYLGISIMHSDVSSYFPGDGRDVFSLTKDLFPGILRDHFQKGEKGIYGSACNYYWNDVGNSSRLEEASKEIGKILPLL